jgi:phosphoesterase RecJ-like protein
MIMSGVQQLDWEAAAALLHDAQRFLLVTHAIPLPDGDAVGSIVGLARMLKQQGKDCTLLIAAPISDRFAFLTADAGIVSLDTLPASFHWDAVVALDCSRLDQAGGAQSVVESCHAPLLVIDHHATNPLYGAVNLVDSSVTSACALVHALAQRMSLPMDEGTATALLTGMVTDTLCFRIDGVTADLLTQAADLMRLGAPLKLIIENTLSRLQAGTLALHARALSRARCEDGVYWAAVLDEDFRATGLEPTSSYGLQSLLITDRCCQIAAVFAQLGDHVAVELRAVPGFDVSQIARQFGGGGHVGASGFQSDQPIDDVIAAALPLLRQIAAQGTPLYE